MITHCEVLRGSAQLLRNLVVVCALEVIHCRICIEALIIRVGFTQRELQGSPFVAARGRLSRSFAHTTLQHTLQEICVGLQGICALAQRLEMGLRPRFSCAFSSP